MKADKDNIYVQGGATAAADGDDAAAAAPFSLATRDTDRFCYLTWWAIVSFAEAAVSLLLELLLPALLPAPLRRVWAAIELGSFVHGT